MPENVYPHYCWGAAVAFPSFAAVEYILTVANSAQGRRLSQITVDDALLFGIYRSLNLRDGEVRNDPKTHPAIRAYYNVPVGTKDEKSPQDAFVFHLANPVDVYFKMKVAQALEDKPQQLRNWYHYYKACLPPHSEEGTSVENVNDDEKRRIRKRRESAEEQKTKLAGVPDDYYYCPTDSKWRFD